MEKPCITSNPKEKLPSPVAINILVTVKKCSQFPVWTPHEHTRTAMPDLNPQQLAAVRHLSGPLLILAGAGTGKTRVVTERIAYLLRNGLRPDNILAVTFTNKAANEMRSRLGSLAPKNLSLKELVVSTFHSLAVRLLRRDAPSLGYTPSFAICDYGEQISLLKKAASTLRASAAPKPEDALRQISTLKNRGTTPEQYERAAVDPEELTLAALYRRYQDALRRQNCFDFDDLLLQALVLLRTNRDALDHWRGRWRQIMVDEFQDTNNVQFELVRLLAAPLDNLAVVGDDDQSIYAWRGAVAGNILRFREHFPQAVEITLEENYRSTGNILSAANAVIKNNPGRREKNLWSKLGEGKPIRLIPANDQFHEAETVARDIRERVRDAGREKPNWSDFAVIIRANAQSRPFEDEFLAGKIPFRVIGGQSLFDRKEARDVLSYLAVAASPEADNQLLRIINVPPRGIGEKSLDVLTAHALRHGRKLQELLANPEKVEGISAKTGEAMRAFYAQINIWRKRIGEGAFAGLIADMLTESGYRKEVEGLYRDPLEAASRWNEALEVGESLEAYAKANAASRPEELLRDFLAEAALAGRQDDSEKKDRENAVRIITAHSAKGLEFPIVYLPGLEEEIFPHKNAIEADDVGEERRLFYVAMTRARRELILLWNRARVIRGKEAKRFPSRFLEEIPGEFLQKADTPTRQDERLEWLAGIRAKLGRDGA